MTDKKPKRLLFDIVSILTLLLAVPALVKAENIKTSVKVVDTPSFLAVPFEEPISSQDNPTLVGSELSFVTSAQDPASDGYYFIVCKSNDVAGSTQGSPSCPGGLWCVSTFTKNKIVASCSFTPSGQTPETNSWYAFACGKNSGNCSSSSQGMGQTGSPFYVGKNEGEVLSASTESSLNGGQPQLDIKSINLEQLQKNGSINASLNVSNSSNNNIQIDTVNLELSHIDGTQEFTKTNSADVLIASEKLKSLNFNFLGNIKPGNYIGTITLYSKNVLVGKSKSLITIVTATPQVLGASTSYWGNIPVFTIPITLAIVFLLGSLLCFYKASIKGPIFGFRIMDVVGIITLVAAFGFGIFATFSGFQAYIILKSPSMFFDYYPLQISAIFAGVMIFGFLTIERKVAIFYRRTPINLIYILVVAIVVIAFSSGLLFGYSTLNHVVSIPININANFL